MAVGNLMRAGESSKRDSLRDDFIYTFAKIAEARLHEHLKDNWDRTGGTNALTFRLATTTHRVKMVGESIGRHGSDSRSLPSGMLHVPKLTHGAPEDTFVCILCDRPMISSEKASECSFCGRVEKADYLCPEGHYVCEECRTLTAEELIKRTCKHSKERDPVRIANMLMKHPAIPAYGVEHHYLTSCVLLAGMRNLGLFDIQSSSIDRSVALAKIVPLGSCALWGACGAAIGAGIAFSIAMKVDIMSSDGRSLVLKLVSKALREISEVGGPRCCKASVILTLEMAKRILKARYRVKFGNGGGRCEFGDRALQDCLKKGCPLYHESHSE